GAWKGGGAAVCGDWGGVAGGGEKLWWGMFVSPDRRTLYTDWEAEAALMVAKFRAEAAAYLDEPAARVLIAELQAESPVFAALWERRGGHGRAGRVKRLAPPPPRPPPPRPPPPYSARPP